MTTAAQHLSYDTPQGHRGLDCLASKDLQIDETRAAATGVFAAASKDRCGDLLEISGIKTENHQKNPIVLWLHGYDYRADEGCMPIGTTEDPDGKYTVKLLPDDGIAVATTFFSQKTLLASQICALVMEKTVRGQSIGYLEIKIERMYEDERYIGTKLVEVEMIETSWCPVPMNQDAVRSALSRDWAGKSLHPSIKAALSPYASTAPIWTNGFTLGEKTVAKPDPQTNPASQVQIVPTPTPKPKTKAENEPDEPETEEKHGSKACRKAYKALCSAHKACTKAAAGLDDDSDTKGIIDAHVECLKDYAEEIKAHHATKYKDADPITEEEEGKEDESGADETKDDDDEMSDEEKALLASLKRQEQKLKHQLRLRRQSA